MTRAQQQISLFALLASVYIAAFTHLLPLPRTIQEDIVPVLPFQLLITLGSYLLFKLGWGVLTFNDVPAAYAELMGEIDIAKSELRLKGVEVD